MTSPAVICLFACLFVCLWNLVCLFVKFSLMSGQLINELVPDCLKVMLFASCFMLQGR